MAIDPTPKAKRKNLDVVAEYKKAHTKPTASFVVIGKQQSIYPLIAGQCLRNR